MKLNHIIQTSLGLLSVGLLLISGCQKSQDLTNIATDKIDHNFINYDSLLATSKSGWKFLAYPDIKKNPTNKGGFSFFMQFDRANQRVKMVGDFTKEMREQPNVSAYDLKFTSLTTISFSTYSYLHFIADPNTMENGGQDMGWGHRVDTEYSFKDVSTNQDTIYLKGNLQNTTAFLIRATEKDESELMNGKQYNSVIDAFSKANQGKVGLHVKTGNTLSTMTISLDQRQIVFAKEVNQDSIYIHKSGLAYNGSNSILLGEAYEVDGHFVKELRLESGQIKAYDSQGKNLEVVEQEFPIISAFKMFQTGAYSSIQIPYNNTNWIHGFVADNLDWPHYRQVMKFLGNTVSSDLGIGLGIFTSSIRFYGVKLDFKSIQKRIMFNINLGLFDTDRPDAPAPSSKAADEFYNKFSFPYQFRYTFNNDEVFTMYYEGPQFVYAAQFPNLKNAFKNSVVDGEYSLRYTKSNRELLIAFYDKRTNEVLFEGRPY